MRRGQLAAVIVIVLLVAAVAAFIIFSEKRAGQATRMLSVAQFGTQPAPTGQQPSQQSTNTIAKTAPPQLLCDYIEFLKTGIHHCGPNKTCNSKGKCIWV